VIRVYPIKDKNILAMFKNGRSSINQYAIDNNIRPVNPKKLDTITIYMREPKERFIKGVHTFVQLCQMEDSNVDYDTALYFIRNHKVQNEHFIQQMQWIQSLSRQFRGTVVLEPVENLLDLIPNRDAPLLPKITKDERERIKKIDFDLRADYYLYNNKLNTNSNILDLCKEVNHVLS
jgi:hypothetical protein